MLTEVSVVDQRYEAVMDVVNGGESVVDVAARLGVSRQSVHTWLRNYASGGVDGLKDRSHRPHTCPHQMPAIVEARVLELRRLHPGWGPRRIVHQLGRDGFEPLPSTSSGELQQAHSMRRFSTEGSHDVRPCRVRRARPS